MLTWRKKRVSISLYTER